MTTLQRRQHSTTPAEDAQFASQEHEALWLRLVAAALASGFNAGTAVAAADTVSAEWMKRKPAKGKYDTGAAAPETPPGSQVAGRDDPVAFYVDDYQVASSADNCLASSSADVWYAPAAVQRGLGVLNLPESITGYDRTRDGLNRG